MRRTLLVGVLFFLVGSNPVAEEIRQPAAHSDSRPGTNPAAQPTTQEATADLSSEAAATSQAQTRTAEYRLLATEADAMQLCETFMQRMIDGDSTVAFELVRPYLPISKERFERLQAETKKQHGLAELQFGKPVEHAFLRADVISDTLLRYRFVEKFEWDLLYWEFVFYRPTHGWMLNRVGFDDNLDVLLK